MKGLAIPGDIPAVAAIVDGEGHVTLHLLPGAQGDTLRTLLDTPAWDSDNVEGSEELVEALRELMRNRKARATRRKSDA